MWYFAFVVIRLLVTLFFLLTATYSILNYTPFVFYQFIRPRVFGWVNQFVAWHHVWYCAVYVLSVITLIPELKRPKDHAKASLLARRIALAYVVIFGLVAEWLVVTPYLPKLWNDSSSLAAAFLSFVPLLWLAAVDHVAARPARLLRERRAGEIASPDAPLSRGVTTERRPVLIACLSAATYLWLAHLLRAVLRSGSGGSLLEWLGTSAWALGLNLTAMVVVYSILSGAIAMASVTRAPRAWEYAQMVVLAAAAIAGILLELVFPNLAFGRRAPVALSFVAGITLALTWSAIALRRPLTPATAFASGLDLFISPLVMPGAARGDRGARIWTVLQAVAVIAVPLAAFAALGRSERNDWNFLIQKLIVVLEWVLTLGLLLGASRLVPSSKRPAPGLIVPAGLAVASLFGLAHVSQYLPGWTGDGHREANVALDEYAGRDPSFKLLYDWLVRHPGRDPGFYRYLQANSSVSHAAALVAPASPFAANLQRAPGPRPHIFLFVLDSLRRDYLSPFNQAVTFTPQIAQFASESFAFDNAFTHYGGTSLAVPSIWAGGMVIHRTSMPDFPRSNALEHLLVVDGYRWFMSLDSITGPLLAPHPDLVELDRGRRVMDFDLCRTLDELAGRLAGDPEPDRPVFAFSLPQNLHISLRQHAAVPAGEHYPGFFEPYAAEVHRIDSCFGGFVSFLRRSGLYDRSIIVLTTDHGDSLGEGGNWGHGVSIFPEVVRIPLIVHIPESLRPLVTTDLTRVAFSTDIVPTLYSLLNHPVRDSGPLFGSPLFVARGSELSPRRRESFLLASSYGATYGLLRRNGRSLYIADLVNGREYAYDLREQPIGTRTQVADDERRVNQRWIRERIAGIADHYHFHPEP